MITPFGSAKDGKIFNWTSPEVQEQCTKYGFVALDAAIGNAIMIYEKDLVEPEGGWQTPPSAEDTVINSGEAEA